MRRRRNGQLAQRPGELFLAVFLHAFTFRFGLWLANRLAEEGACPAQSGSDRPARHVEDRGGGLVVEPESVDEYDTDALPVVQSAESAPKVVPQRGPRFRRIR
jgi:hypothetical protein